MSDEAQPRKPSPEDDEEDLAAERKLALEMLRFADLGIETFMLQFQPFEAEMRRFAEEVRPRVDRLVRSADSSAA